MLQRIQSVYLLLAALTTGVFYFLFPVYRTGERAASGMDDPVFLTLAVLSTLISLFSIFRYRNRQQQVVSGRINIIINFVHFGLIAWHVYGSETTGRQLDVAAFLPIAAVILIALANRAIMRDEALVRAADRLR